MVETRKVDAESATDFWAVQAFGGYGQYPFEISVVRVDFSEGAQDYGHWGVAKRIISASGSDPMGTINDPVLWESLIALAEQTADRLNKHADCLNCDGTGLLHGAYPCRARG